MLFCSHTFVLFFVAFLAVYWTVKWQRLRVWLLLAASFYFYASWNKWLALVICVSTCMDYVIGLLLEKFASGPARKALLGISIVGNLGLLAYFKYANFFIASMEHLLKATGIHTSMPVLQVLLPVGISFYTFEAISYTVDVYLRRTRAERSLASLLLFITFFPHLVAGPIVRARDFLPQTHRPKRWDWARMHLGLQFFLMGLFKKLALADRMAMYADPVFADPRSYSSAALWMAVLAYTVQIYCDFSGYSDMAIGCAHMLGYKLVRNFNIPYVAPNISEFWRRWHMSLSSWLRDYLYIPLGGSRGSSLRTSCNLLLTMTLGGLWHGASWTFVVWGFLHGLLLVVHRGIRAVTKKYWRLDAVLQSSPGSLLRVATTLLCVALGWVLFRAPTFRTAASMMKRLVIPTTGASVPLAAQGLWWTLALVVAAHLFTYSGGWKRFAERAPAPLLSVGYAVTACLALILVPELGKTFIYFQF